MALLSELFGGVFRRRPLHVALVLVVVPLMAATGVALILLWPGATPAAPAATTENFAGRVTEVRVRECPPSQAPVETPTGIIVTRCGTIDVALADGPDAGRTVSTPVPAGPGAPTVEVGDHVVLIVVTDPGDASKRMYSIVDHERGAPIFVLALIFAMATVVFARWRGLAALGGLGISFAVLLFFMVPAVMEGRPPLLVAVVGAAAIMFAVLYLTHGVSVRTTVAVLGTLAALVLTGVAGTLAAAATHLTGFGGEDASTLAVFYRDVDLYGLLLAGIIIGSLGVLDDVTVTQAVTVEELAGANPDLSRRELYRAAARVGRAHIASVINTLVLAYAGASLPLMLLISASGSRVGSVLTSQLIGQEIVRSIVGSLGLIAAVPITTALAAFISGRREPGVIRPPRPRSEPEPEGAALSAGRAAIAAPWADS